MRLCRMRVYVSASLCTMQGVSRSATIVIAYIMWKNHKSYDEAYAHVKAARGRVCVHVTTSLHPYHCEVVVLGRRPSKKYGAAKELWCFAGGCRLRPCLVPLLFMVHLMHRAPFACSRPKACGAAQVPNTDCV